MRKKEEVESEEEVLYEGCTIQYLSFAEGALIATVIPYLMHATSSLGEGKGDVVKAV